MALAYCILAHKNPTHVVRLLRAIWAPDNIYVLHFEKRAPRMEHQIIAELAGQYQNVRILESRPIQWGRYSQLKAQLDALRVCLNWKSNWTHFINLTGQDFPLLQQSEIVKELATYSKKSFVSSFDPVADGTWGDANERMIRIHLDSPLLEWLLRRPGIGRRIRALFGWSNCLPFLPFFNRAAPESFRYFGGANHFILSAEAGAYLLEDARAQEIIGWLRWSGFPEESSVQSALMNSHLKDRVINDDRRAIFWAYPGAPSPETLTSADISRLEEARAAGRLFARKFDPQVDEEIVRILEGQLLSCQA